MQRSSTCLNRGINLSKPFVAPDSGVDSSKSFSFESNLSKSSESSSQVLPDSTLSVPESSSGDNPSSESPYLEDTQVTGDSGKGGGNSKGGLMGPPAVRRSTRQRVIKKMYDPETGTFVIPTP